MAAAPRYQERLDGFNCGGQREDSEKGDKEWNMIFHNGVLKIEGWQEKNFGNQVKEKTGRKTGLQSPPLLLIQG